MSHSVCTEVKRQRVGGEGGGDGFPLPLFKVQVQIVNLGGKQLQVVLPC